MPRYLKRIATCFSNSIIFLSASRFLPKNSFSSSSSLLLIPSLSFTILSKVLACSPTGSPSLLFRGLNRRFMFELLSILRRELNLSCFGSMRLHCSITLQPASCPTSPDILKAVKIWKNPLSPITSNCWRWVGGERCLRAWSLSAGQLALILLYWCNTGLGGIFYTGQKESHISTLFKSWSTYFIF